MKMFEDEPLLYCKEGSRQKSNSNLLSADLTFFLTEDFLKNVEKGVNP